VKGIAREFNVPVLIASQLNRAVELRQDPHPKLSDIRESGAVEQDADVVLGLTRDAGSRLLDIDVLKQRNGRQGDRISITFDPSRVAFGDE
jgi:replicative DNA helicase